MARPKKQIDPLVVKNLAKERYSARGIARILGVDVNTILKRFSAEIEAGRHEAVEKLNRIMWNMLDQEPRYVSPALLMWAIERFDEKEEQSKVDDPMKKENLWVGEWGKAKEDAEPT